MVTPLTSHRSEDPGLPPSENRNPSACTTGFLPLGYLHGVSTVEVTCYRTPPRGNPGTTGIRLAPYPTASLRDRVSGGSPRRKTLVLRTTCPNRSALPTIHSGSRSPVGPPSVRSTHLLSVTWTTTETNRDLLQGRSLPEHMSPTRNAQPRRPTPQRHPQQPLHFRVHRQQHNLLEQTRLPELTLGASSTEQLYHKPDRGPTLRVSSQPPDHRVPSGISTDLDNSGVHALEMGYLERDLPPEVSLRVAKERSDRRHRPPVP